MCNAKRTVLITMVICVVFAGISSAADKQPDLDYVMTKVTENLNSLKSYIIKLEAHGLGNVSVTGAQKWHPSSLNGRSKYHHIQELKYDGNRFSFSRTEWGDLNSRVRNLSKKDADYKRYLWNGKNTYQYQYFPKELKSGGRLILNLGGLGRYKYEKSILGIFTGSTLMGYYTEDTVRIDEIARQAKSVKMLKRMEPVSGSKCYVVEIVSRHGDYRLWIDPAHGYNIAKAQVLRDQGDIWIRDYRIEAGEQRRLLVSDIKFRKVDDLWIPVQADIERNTTFTDGGYKRSKLKLKVTEIDIAPDHEALKSFLPDDILDGTTVQIPGNPKLRYYWQDGTVVDKEGKKVDLEKIHKEMKKINTKS